MSKFTVNRTLYTLAYPEPQLSISKVEFDNYIDEYCSIYAPSSNEKMARLSFYNHVELMKQFYNAMQGTDIAFIENCLETIRNTIVDKRDENKITYPIDVLIFVIFLAKICDCNKAKEIAAFYAERHLELLLLVPGMPSPKHRVSAAIITAVLRMISPEQMNKLMKTYFTSIKVTLDKMIEANCQRDRPKEIDKETLSFDGQELKSSFRRDNHSRQCKAGHVVSLFNCTLKQAIASVLTNAKNKEVNAFLTMMATLNIDITGKIVMCDALNSKEAVSKEILSKGADYLLNIKSNGHKDLLNHITAIFNREHDMTESNDLIINQFSEKQHGRFDVWTVEVLPASKLSPNFKCPHDKVQTLICYTKNSQKIINGKTVGKVSSRTRYYLSSLSYSKKNARQIMQSISDYWAIEAHHGRLDDKHLFDQDSIQSCNENYLGNIASINKIAYNFLSYKRMQKTAQLGRKTPVTYASITRSYRVKALYELFYDLYEFYNTKTS